MFKGFKFEDQSKQAEIDAMGYNDEVVSGILEKYQDCIQPLVIGKRDFRQAQRGNDLANHMAFAASTGHYVGVAMSCFCKIGGMFAGKLPVPIEQMDDDAKEYLIDIHDLYSGIQGFSESGMKYFEDNESKVLMLAESGDVKMQYFIGKYNIILYREWVEKAALSGYDRAYYDAGCAFDVDEDPGKDLGKAAYWYHKGCLIKNTYTIPCFYNLGVMYAQGDFVEKNMKTASFYLSLVYRNAHKTQHLDLEKDAEEYMQNNSIELQSPPYILGDREMDPKLAELSNVYSR